MSPNDQARMRHQQSLLATARVIGVRSDGTPVYSVAGGQTGAAQLAGLQVARPQMGTVERAPQTTAPPAPGPFSRHSRKASLLAFQSTGNAFGGSISQPLKAAGGYLRALNILVEAVGGAGVAAVAAADAPWNVIQSILLRDPFGEPVVQCGGYSLRLLNAYGGQAGFYNNADPAVLPSFTTPAATGNFRFRIRVPAEVISSDGYTSLPLMNASSVPSIDINLAALATVFSTVPTTVPTITIRVEEEYWVAPVDNPNLAVPDVGSSAQWSQSVAAQQIASAAQQEVQLPRVGTFIHSVILVLRNSAGARIDAFPDPIEFWVDQTPYFLEPFTRRVDEMFETFGITRPTGVLVYTFRDSTMPNAHADSADEWLHTTPGTLLEVRGLWGTIASAPANLEVLTGEVYPASGSPYSVGRILE